MPSDIASRRRLEAPRARRSRRSAPRVARTLRAGARLPRSAGVAPTGRDGRRRRRALGAFAAGRIDVDAVRASPPGARPPRSTPSLARADRARAHEALRDAAAQSAVVVDGAREPAAPCGAPWSRALATAGPRLRRGARRSSSCAAGRYRAADHDAPARRVRVPSLEPAPSALIAPPLVVDASTAPTCTPAALADFLDGAREDRPRRARARAPPAPLVRLHHAGHVRAADDGRSGTRPLRRLSTARRSPRLVPEGAALLRARSRRRARSRGSASDVGTMPRAPPRRPSAGSSAWQQARGPPAARRARRRAPRSRHAAGQRPRRRAAVAATPSDRLAAWLLDAGGPAVAARGWTSARSSVGPRSSAASGWSSRSSSRSRTGSSGCGRIRASTSSPAMLPNANCGACGLPGLPGVRRAGGRGQGPAGAVHGHRATSGVAADRRLPRRRRRARR